MQIAFKSEGEIDILLQRKIKRVHSQHIYSKRTAKGSSSDNKNNIGRKLGISEMKNNKNNEPHRPQIHTK